MQQPLQATDADGAGDEEARFRRAVGRRIFLRRVQLDLTQAELGAAAGVSRTFVSALERGRGGLGAYRLTKLADALRLPPADLVAPPD